MIDTVSMVVPQITENPEFIRMKNRLDTSQGVVGVSGLWGSSAPILAANLAESSDTPLLYICAHLDEADTVADDLQTTTGQQTAILSAWEFGPDAGSGGGEIHDERLQLCTRIRRDCPPIIVAPVQALIQSVPDQAAIERNTLHLQIDTKHQPDDIAQWLVDRGFERLERVESPGDFALRGDILDIYAPDRENPIRLEFFDDQLEAIREFDIFTQRSRVSLSSANITALPHRQKLDRSALTSFLTYLPTNTRILLDRPADVQEMAQQFWNRTDRREQLIRPDDLMKSLAAFLQIHLTRIGAAVGGEGDVFHFDTRSLTRFEGKTDAAVRELCAVAQTHSVLVYCPTEGERSRLREIITEANLSMPDTIQLKLGIVHQGFEWFDGKTIVVGHHEIFHRTPTRRIRKTHAAKPIESALDLIPGDIVVHVVHGIARFKGMKMMEKPGSNKAEEFITLEFADSVLLHVTTTQIDLIQKYIGAGGIKPSLSKLGGTRWKKTKDKVQDAISELADTLLRVQIEREQGEGNSYPTDTRWQREFEESFPYEDTEDQIVVSGEIKGDLIKPRPMDRLVCGDVGFGKTELAIRAAFKVVEFGKQVAVLVPTTILAEQHARTFANRLADYPFVVECLSRFKTAGDQKKVIERAKKGQVDIVIGTHRLLSKDVGFADLGLVIIDEEQRFGVEHKERLKQMRATVDVLSLSATPIPRTLHMALVGLRDVSALQSPPMDRRAIASHVSQFSADVIREAIRRELAREGQVYFLHNIVHNIETVADRIRQLVPEARVIVGHGQMKQGELEGVMRKFMNKEADVLVATTIIESGVDIPNANTIFINNADRFGLADLHQLRGRVGRSVRRGYCYFLLPADRTVTPKAAKRLKAIEEFSDLGAGFRIAMRDLEIRGAGNLLGAEQSGHIAAVGYEMYCQLLERAVKRKRQKPDADTAPPAARKRKPQPAAVGAGGNGDSGQADERNGDDAVDVNLLAELLDQTNDPESRPHIELEVIAHIPRAYIPAERTRIDLYRRIASCTTPKDLQQLEEDIRDTFGPFPEPVGNLLQLAELRILAAIWGISKIIFKEPDVVFTVSKLADVDPVFANAPGTARSPDKHTVHLRMPKSYLESATLLPVLRRLLTKSI